jgi:hypothetical protein
MAQKVLPRFGHKGQLVKYPKEWGRRMMHTGINRFDTSCDIIVGKCACGERHAETDHWIRENLQAYNMRIETIDEWIARAHN